MRKFKNLVIGGIETKVVNLCLISIIVITAVFQVMNYYQSKTLAEVTEETVRRQDESLTEITDGIMGAVIDSSLERNTELQSQLVDEVFRGLGVRVDMMAKYASKLFSDPSAVTPAAYSAPDPAREGQVVCQTILADGVSEEEIADRIGIAANMTGMMVTLFGASEDTNSCFIALPEGVFLVTDDRPASKFAESGERVSYDPRNRPWYQQAVSEGKMIFTDLEVDSFTGEIGIVCAMPVYVDGELVAVVGSDLFLTSIQDEIQASDEKGGFECVINRDGHVVFSPKESGIFSAVESSIAKDLRENPNEELAALVRDALQGSTGVRLVHMDGEEYYMVGSPMKTVNWTLVYILDRTTADTPTKMLRNNYLEIQAEATQVYVSKMKHLQFVMVLALLAVAAIMFVLAVFLGKRIVGPLNRMTKKVASQKEANLEFKMEEEYRTGDEIEVLAESFAQLSHRTVEYVAEVRRVTAEKERIGTELSMAEKIQQSMLPSNFPAFPDRKEFDIYATMDPAREVGGDFYDFFLIDKDHLCLVIADVSGKGVPAALFMMISKIIIESCAMLGRSTGEILTKTNEALCSNNKLGMFVTVWLGVLDINTGRLIAANAGHEYPAVCSSGGQFKLFKDRHGIVIGAMDGISYKEYEMVLEPGDKLFVYTDGVPEATRHGDELFGTDRMLEALNQEPGASPQGLLANVRRAVDDFVGEDEQFDDLTMMAFEYRGPQGQQ